MAIQNRRGTYADFDPQKLVPGEWAVVQSGDPNSTRGKSVYMAFNVGDVERMATYEDMQENIVSATTDVQEQFADELTQTIADANSTMADIQDDADTLIANTSTTVSQLTGQVTTAVSAANTATSNANAATARANDAVESIQHIIDGNNAVLSWNGRTGEVQPEAGDYTSAQITHGTSTVANALTFDSAPTAKSERAVQSGGVYSYVNEQISTLTEQISTLTAYETLTITRVISTTYMTDTQFSRLFAYKKNGCLHLNFNAEFSNGLDASTESKTIGTISGWHAIGDVFILIPCQTDSTKILNLAVRANGQIQVYSTKPISSWYRTFVTIPSNN